MSATHVVSSFLLRRDGGKDAVLLVRRSDRVRTYRGAWGAVSGYLEPGVSPLEQAYTEIREEVGLDRSRVQLLKVGQPIAFHDDTINQDWVVHPFLFGLDHDAVIQTDWEATTHEWVSPAQVAARQTVPMLPEALAAVYPHEVADA